MKGNFMRVLLAILMIFSLLLTSCGLSSNKTGVESADDSLYSQNRNASYAQNLNEAPNVSLDVESAKDEMSVTNSGSMMAKSKGMKEFPEPIQAESVTEDFNTEEYNYTPENRFLSALQSPLSTFSIDVDTASYSNIRRFLADGQLPPADAVRIEEMINYFTYDYPQPEGDVPFTVNTEVSKCPWNDKHYLALVGLQGKKIDTKNVPASNLVFLLDVSGSMEDPDKLPLLKSAFKLLTEQLRKEDRISIVVYAGAAGKIIDGVSGDEKGTILDALDELEAGGSTAGGEGIELAYSTAKKNFIKGGNNRVILATDGDFNIGVSDEGQLTRIIENKRKDGIYLSILGFGTGNYKDSKMESLADKGNGNYSYIDNLTEAKKVLVNQMTGTLFTIAKDVKLQVEFNPSKVKEYRLIGYENRLLNKEDFNDDTKDAGELGAGHTVTALYELVPEGVEETGSSVDSLKYQDVKVKESNELMNVKLRYKLPDAEKSKLLTVPVAPEKISSKPSPNLSFAAAVAEFGLLLKNSEYKGTSSYSNVLDLATSSKGNDSEGYRAEFLKLVGTAEELQ